MTDPHHVTIYSTPTCVYCHLAKNYFTEQGLPFQEIDVASNQAAAREMMEKSGQMGVPVIDIDGTIIVGFDQGAIRQALGISGVQIRRK